MTEIAIRLVFSLIVVVGLIAFLARYVARTRGGLRGNSVIRVTHRQAVSRAAALTVVEVEGRTLLLGITEQNISLVTELAPATAQPADTPTRASAEADPSDDRPGPHESGASAEGSLQGLDLEPQPIADEEFRDLLLRERAAADNVPFVPTPRTATETHSTAPGSVAVAAGKHRASSRQPKAGRTEERKQHTGALDGSVLSPAAWSTAVSVLRGRKSA